MKSGECIYCGRGGTLTVKGVCPDCLAVADELIKCGLGAVISKHGLKREAAQSAKRIVEYAEMLMSYRRRAFVD